MALDRRYSVSWRDATNLMGKLALIHALRSCAATHRILRVGRLQRFRITCRARLSSDADCQGPRPLRSQRNSGPGIWQRRHLSNKYSAPCRPVVSRTTYEQRLDQLGLGSSHSFLPYLCAKRAQGAYWRFLKIRNTHAHSLAEASSGGREDN